METLAQLGILLILYMLGVEFSLARLRGVWREALVSTLGQTVVVLATAIAGSYVLPITAAEVCVFPSYPHPHSRPVHHMHTNTRRRRTRQGVLTRTRAVDARWGDAGGGGGHLLRALVDRGGRDSAESAR
jgi:hypothetical protein